MDNKNLLGKILSTAITRAADPQHIAFCRHAFEKHASFPKAMQILAESIAADAFVIDRSIGIKDVSKKNVPISRFILSSLTWQDGGISLEAVAVFSDLQTLANKLANPNWPWKPRAEYVFQRYGNFATTRVISAYVKSAIPNVEGLTPLTPTRTI